MRQWTSVDLRSGTMVDAEARATVVDAEARATFSFLFSPGPQLMGTTPIKGGSSLFS